MTVLMPSKLKKTFYRPNSTRSQVICHFLSSFFSSFEIINANQSLSSIYYFLLPPPAYFFAKQPLFLHREIGRKQLLKSQQLKNLCLLTFERNTVFCKSLFCQTIAENIKKENKKKNYGFFSEQKYLNFCAKNQYSTFPFFQLFPFFLNVSIFVPEMLKLLTHVEC